MITYRQPVWRPGYMKMKIRWRVEKNNQGLDSFFEDLDWNDWSGDLAPAGKKEEEQSKELEKNQDCRISQDSQSAQDIRMRPGRLPKPEE